MTSMNFKLFFEGELDQNQTMSQHFDQKSSWATSDFPCMEMMWGPQIAGLRMSGQRRIHLYATLIEWQALRRVKHPEIPEDTLW